MKNFMENPRDFGISIQTGWGDFTYSEVKKAILKVMPNGIIIKDGEVKFELRGKKYVVRRLTTSFEGDWYNSDSVVVTPDYKETIAKRNRLIRSLRSAEKK